MYIFFKCKIRLFILIFPQPILYSYWRSSCSWRVRIALELKSVDYEYRAIHLVKNGGQQLTSEYGEINPLNQVRIKKKEKRGKNHYSFQNLEKYLFQVPAFVYNDETITQSMAILEYLEAIFPEVKLLPYEPLQKAKVRNSIFKMKYAAISISKYLSSYFFLGSRNLRSNQCWYSANSKFKCYE